MKVPIALFNALIATTVILGLVVAYLIGSAHGQAAAHSRYKQVRPHSHYYEYHGYRSQNR